MLAEVINPTCDDNVFFCIGIGASPEPKTGKKHANFDIEKDATYRLASLNCAGRVSVSLTVMLQELRTPVEVEGNFTLPHQQVLLL